MAIYLKMMRKMMRKINNPWNEIQPPQDDVNARRVDHTHPLDLFWAKDSLGRYLFIYEFPEAVSIAKNNLPEIQGLQIEIFSTPNKPVKKRLILLLKETENWEIFLALCNDIIHSTRAVRDGSWATQIFIRRLKRWQDFLKKGRKEILSEDEIKGLIGELIFLRNYLTPSFGLEHAVRFWQGPEDLPQDFNVNDSAVEIKCQSGGSSPTIHISSADQLNSQLHELYLFVVTLGKTPPEAENAVNLPLLITELRDGIELNAPTVLERFNDLIYLTGYIDSDLYLDFSYILSKVTSYIVTDEFPKICRPDIHPGIVRVSYTLSLDECTPFIQYPDWMEEKI